MQMQKAHQGRRAQLHIQLRTHIIIICDENQNE